jgi:hypothetical protein
MKHKLDIQYRDGLAVVYIDGKFHVAPMAPIDVNQRYRPDEACAYWRISRAQLTKDIADNKIKVIREGTMVRIPGTEIIRRSTIGEACAQCSHNQETALLLAKKLRDVLSEKIALEVTPCPY